MEVKILAIQVNIDADSIIDKTRVHWAMALRYKEIVLGTFGPNGVNRPATWPALSPAYAKRVKPPVPTLKRTIGRIPNSIHATANESCGSVFTEEPLAMYHQFAMGHNKYRPFFQFDQLGQPTAFIVEEMRKAALDAINGMQ